MKKTVVALIAVLLVFPLCSAAAEGFVGQTLPDFTVETLDGGSYTLSEALEQRELVLVNLFATWCPPCRMEFPFLETAWQQYRDRVDVIALSLEPSDTLQVLAGFAQELDLSFPMGRDTGDLGTFLQVMYIPVTVIVDKDRQILSCEVGAQTSAEAFCGWFDELL